MKMISSAKLHRAQGAIAGMLPYSNKLTEMLDALLYGSEEQICSPYTDKRIPKRIAIIAISSSTSLCGGFNANIIRHTLQAIKKYCADGVEEITIYPVGRKMAQALADTEGVNVMDDYLTIGEKPLYTDIASMTGRMMNLYAEGKVDRIMLMYAHYKNMAVQEMREECFLPVSHKEKSSESILPIEYIIEPSPKELLDKLIPQSLIIRLFATMLDASAAEHAARTFAMQQATDNGEALLQELNLQYNKGRQQAITNELQDIVGGSMK